MAAYTLLYRFVTPLDYCQVCDAFMSDAVRFLPRLCSTQQLVVQLSCFLLLIVIAVVLFFVDFLLLQSIPGIGQTLHSFELLPASISRSTFTASSIESLPIHN